MASGLMRHTQLVNCARLKWLVSRGHVPFASLASQAWTTLSARNAPRDISVDGECTRCADGTEPGHSGEPVCWPCGTGLAGKAGTCTRCQEAKEPNLNTFCTNPAVDTQPGCSVSGVCYDLENISTPLGRTGQACLELGACCIRGHAGYGCVSYLSQDECRAGSAAFQFRKP